jgi:hypothetical protein
MIRTNEFQHKVLKAATRVSYFAVILLTASFVVACDDDDDDHGISSVAGEWVGTKSVLAITVDGIPPINETDEDFAGEAEFLQDGTAIYTEDGEVVEGTWAQNNNKLILSIEDGDFNEDLSGTYTIQELSQTKLRLYIEREGTFEDPESGMEFEATVKATLYFDRK